MHNTKNLPRKWMFFLLALYLPFPITTYAWTIEMGFEEGSLGEKVTGFSDAAGYSFISNEQKFSGMASAQLNIKKNSDGWGTWGGRKFFPSPLYEGDEIWIRVRTFMPENFDYTTNFALKFLRTSIKSADEKHLGYIDMYINNNGTLKYQNELYTTELLIFKDGAIFTNFLVGETIIGDTSNASAKITAIKTTGLVFEYLSAVKFARWEILRGQVSNASAMLNRVTSNSVTNLGIESKVEKGVWETYIYNVRYSSINPAVRLYKIINKNVQLIFEDKTDFTLKNSTDYSDSFLLFTYWNGASPTTQKMYVDDIYISNTSPPPDFSPPKAPNDVRIQ